MAKVVIEGFKPDAGLKYTVSVTQVTATETSHDTIKVYLRDNTGSASVVLTIPEELADAIAKAISGAR